MRSTLAASARSRALAVFALMVLVLSGNVASAAIYYVRTDGNDSNSGTSADTSGAWQTIGRATVASLAAGDIVYVKAGAYSEKLDVQVQGSLANPLQFIADTRGSVSGWSPGTVTLDASVHGEAIKIDSYNYVQFLGFRIRGESGSNGLYIKDNSGILFKNCEIYNSSRGVHVENAGVDIINCSIHDNSNDGVYILSGTANVYHSTVAYNASDGFEQDGGTLTITNSIIANNSSDGLDRNSGTMNHTYNLVYGNGSSDFEGTSLSTGEISVDPQFVSSSDLHLRSTSPAINAGTGLAGTVDEDYHGNPRPYDGGWDMGFHAFGSTSGSVQLLFVTQNDGYFTTQERIRKSILEAWDYAVTAIADSDTQANYDAALASVRVVYVPEEVQSTDVGYKLRETTLGVLFDEDALADEFGLSTTSSDPGDHTTLTITDSSHYITSPFSTGALSYASPAADVKSFSGTLASGMQLLADWTSSSALGVVDSGGSLANTYNSSSTAFGRRVGFMHGGGFDWSDLTDDGLTILRRGLEWASDVDLVGHWKLDETSGTTALDQSDIGNDGTYTNGPSLGQVGPYPGYLATAARFNGTSNYVDIPDLNVYSTHTSAGLTVAAWVQIQAVNTDADGQARQPIVAKGDSSDWEWALYAYDNGNAGFSVWQQAGSGHTEISGGNLPIGSWVHVAATFEAGIANRVYVNGVEVASSSSFTGSPHNGTANVRIAARIDGQFLNADISDVRIYSRALPQSEIVELYGLIGHWRLDEATGTTAADSTPMANDGTYTNGPTLNNAGAYPGDVLTSVDFDGTDDFVDLPDMDFDFSRGFTASFWAKPTNSPGLGQFFGFFDMSNGQDVDEIWLGWVSGAVGFQLYLTDTDDGSSLRTIEDNTSFDVGKWTHCVATIDSAGNATLYRNGVVTKSGFNTSIPTNVTRTLNTIGTSVWNDSFPGSLDDVRLYNRPLSAIEVAELYGLVGHWKMDEGAGSTAADATAYSNDASISGATWTSDCVGNVALDFDGAGDVAQTNTAFDPPATGAVAYWMQASGPITARERTFGVGGNWEARVETTGTLSFDLGASPFVGNEPFSTTSTVDTADRWYHIFAQFNAVTDAYEVYVNGELEASGTSPVDLVEQVDGVLSFGTRTGSTEYWQGALRDFRIYNRWLSGSEISELSGLVGYWKLDETSGSVATDSSPLDNDGTYTNGVILGQPGNINLAAEFDGSDDYVAVVDHPSLQMDDTFSLSAWIRADNSSNVNQMILNKEGEYELAVFPGGELRWGIKNTDPDWSWHSTGHIIAIGKWTHVAMTYNSGTVTTFADGVAVDTYNGSGAVGDQYTSLNELRIGGRSNNPPGKYFDGRLDDVKLYNRVLCAEEVFRQYKGGRPAGIRILRWLEAR